MRRYVRTRLGDACTLLCGTSRYERSTLSFAVDVAGLGHIGLVHGIFVVDLDVLQPLTNTLGRGLPISDSLTRTLPEETGWKPYESAYESYQCGHEAAIRQGHVLETGFTRKCEMSQ